MEGCARYSIEHTITYHIKLHVQTVYLMMKTRCSKHVHEEDNNN